MAGKHSKRRRLWVWLNGRPFAWLAATVIGVALVASLWAAIYYVRLVTLGFAVATFVLAVTGFVLLVSDARSERRAAAWQDYYLARLEYVLNTPLQRPEDDGHR